MAGPAALYDTRGKQRRGREKPGSDWLKQAAGAGQEHIIACLPPLPFTPRFAHLPQIACHIVLYRPPPTALRLVFK